MRSLSSWTLGLRSCAGGVPPLRRGLGWQAQNGQHLALTALNGAVYRCIISSPDPRITGLVEPSNCPTPWWISPDRRSARKRSAARSGTRFARGVEWPRC